MKIIDWGLENIRDLRRKCCFVCVCNIMESIIPIPFRINTENYDLFPKLSLSEIQAHQMYE